MNNFEIYYHELLHDLTTYLWLNRIYLYSPQNGFIHLEFEIEDQSLHCYGSFPGNSENIRKNIQEYYEWKVKYIYFHTSVLTIKDL